MKRIEVPLLTESVIPVQAVLPYKLGGGVQPAFQNPYTGQDQNLRFS